MESSAIRIVEDAEVERALSVQVMAFASDPTARWLYPAPDDYLRRFPEFARVFGGRAFEHGSAYASDGFTGAALWLPDGVHPDGEAIEAFFRASVAEPKLTDVLGVLDQMDAFHTKDPHWYLAIIGVDPAHQGRGIGSELLRHSLAPCDEQGLAAYLESSNPANVPLYQRHGFEVLGEIQIGASPTVYPMLRAPRG